jgi:hypothetical protein
MAVPGRTVPAVVASGQDGDRLARVDHADLDLLAGEPRRRLRKTASARGSLAVAGIAHREDGWQLCRDELTGVDVRVDSWDIRGR